LAFVEEFGGSGRRLDGGGGGGIPPLFHGGALLTLLLPVSRYTDIILFIELNTFRLPNEDTVDIMKDVDTYIIGTV